MIPHEAVHIPIRLAFAAGPYLDALTGDRAEKLFDLDRTRRKEPLMVPFVLERARTEVGHRVRSQRWINVPV